MDISRVKELTFTNYLTGVLIFLVTFLVVRNLYKHLGRECLPPGPWGLPFVGFFPFLAADTHTQFWELSKKYGPILGLTIGTRYVVILNDIECYLKTYRKDKVNSRPEKSFQLCSEFDSFADMVDAPWKEHRKFFASFTNRLLKSEDGVPQIESILNEEMDILLEKLAKLKDKSRVNVLEVFEECITNTPLKYTMDRAIPGDHPIAKAMSVQRCIVLNQATVQDLTSCFPEWRWLLRPILSSQRILKKATNDIEAFIYDEIARHKQTLDPDNPRDYMDLFLLRQKEEGNDVVYSDGVLNSNVQFIMVAGSDTVIISTSWLFILMAKYPDIQEKVFREIIEALGPDQKPKWSEHSQLPYTMAFIYESQRFKTVVPISTIRKASKDIYLDDVLIPKDTILAGNFWAIHNDERYWGDPENFRPERFLSEDGGLNTDKSFVAFSVGKRDCPGKPQALVELFTLLATVLQKYKVLPPVGGVSLEQHNDLVSGPRHPFVKIEARIA